MLELVRQNQLRFILQRSTTQRRRARGALVLVIPLVCAFCTVAHAQIRTDGSLNRPIVSLSGPNFLITEAQGRLTGSNLFYSFQVFNVGTAESATFVTTTSGLANVISRVTGGSPSQINGPINLQSTNAAPNFFFINPAGVVFGKGAQINVPGGFHVSTADYIKFPDGNFYADPKAVSTLSSAAPEAFGFLGTTRASITIDGVNLQTVSANADQPISIVAGDIEINGATVQTNGSDIRVVAVGSNAQEVGLTGALPIASGNLSIVNAGLVTTSAVSGLDGGNIWASAGNVTIKDGGQISATTSTSGNAGAVTVKGGTLVIDGGSNPNLTGIDSETYSQSSNTDGLGNAGDVNVTVVGTLSILSGGEINTGTFTSGKGGTITVKAGTLVIDGGSNPKLTGIDSETLSDMGKASGFGNAGDVNVSVVGTLSILNGGEISADTFTSGSAGAVTVNAGTLVIDGSGSNPNFTGIASGTDSNSINGSKTGNAGDVTVTVGGTLSILNGGGITTTTFTSGNAGAVTVKAGTLVIDDSGSNPNFTGIASETASKSGKGGFGNAGDVNVTVVGTLSILNGGEINTSTYTSGNGGAITVNAATVTIDGGSGGTFTGIASDALSNSVNGGDTGNAGGVSVTVNGALSILNAGTIATDTFTSGHAGAVTVNAGTISGDSNGLIGAVAHTGSSGQTGTVTVQASEGITLSNGASFSIINDAMVVDPRGITPTLLTVKAPNISLTNGAQITAASSDNVAASDIHINFGNQMALDSGVITTSANTGNGGAIVIQGGGPLSLTSSAISTSASTGNGGAIVIQDGGALVLNSSQITTSVTGPTNGNGGDITISGPSLVMNTGFIQANTVAANARGGKVSIEVDALVASGGTLFVGGSTPFKFAPGVFGFNVIQAAAPNGVSEIPQLSVPVVDIIGSISALPAVFLDSGGLGRSPCAIVGGSSLSQVGRGGLPPRAGDLLWIDSIIDVPAKSPAGPGSGQLIPQYRAMGSNVSSTTNPCWS